MKKPPAEVVASLLAVTTLFYPMHLPTWAIFVGWAGTFAIGGPSIANMKRIWPVMPLGSVVGCIIVLLFGQASTMLAGTSLIVAKCVILFCFNGGMMALARFIPTFKLIPGMFFGFASFFACVFGGFGPQPGDPIVAAASVIAMNALGPIYAWLTANLSAPHGDHH